MKGSENARFREESAWKAAWGEPGKHGPELSLQGAAGRGGRRPEEGEGTALGAQQRRGPGAGRAPGGGHTAACPLLSGRALSPAAAAPPRAPHSPGLQASSSAGDSPAAPLLPESKPPSQPLSQLLTPPLATLACCDHSLTVYLPGMIGATLQAEPPAEPRAWQGADAHYGLN